jgi:hypothetical protein
MSSIEKFLDNLICSYTGTLDGKVHLQIVGGANHSLTSAIVQLGAASAVAKEIADEIKARNLQHLADIPNRPSITKDTVSEQLLYLRRLNYPIFMGFIALYAYNLALFNVTTDENLKRRIKGILYPQNQKFSAIATISSKIDINQILALFNNDPIMVLQVMSQMDSVVAPLLTDVESRAVSRPTPMKGKPKTLAQKKHLQAKSKSAKKYNWPLIAAIFGALYFMTQGKK